MERRGEAAGLHYESRLPRRDVRPPWPLLLFLHGAGERGGPTGEDLHRVKLHGPWKGPGAEQFLIVAPQCPTGIVWPALAEELVAFVQHITEEYVVDRSRMYVTGLSLGAFGAWALLHSRPSLFAAAAAICGAFSPALPKDTGLSTLLGRAKNPVEARSVQRLLKMPVWLFHGAKDKVVDVAGSRNAFLALGGAARGEELKLTVYDDAAHHIWGMAYRDPELYTWLLSHRLPGDALGAQARGPQPGRGRPSAATPGAVSELFGYVGDYVASEDDGDAEAEAEAETQAGPAFQLPEVSPATRRLVLAWRRTSCAPRARCR